jgi:hypothetical protein
LVKQIKYINKYITKRFLAMNYKDLHNISNLSQEILTESANDGYSHMDRWPYTSPYLQEERAEGVKEYQPRKRNPLPAAKPLSGKSGDRSGYGADEKFNKPDDKIAKPGTTVPKPKKGGYGRIMSNIPYGIGDHRDKTQSNVSRIRGRDTGAPRSQKLPPQKKKKNLEIVRKTKNEEFQNWVNNLLDEGYDLSGYTWEGLYEEYIQIEAYNLYDVILSHLLDEGYADNQEAAEAIMVNMSEDWRNSIIG